MSKQIKEAFGNMSFYEILHITDKASTSEIKKAYYKEALKYHPDKNSDKDATKKFQALSIIHSVLSNPTSRKFYDKNHYMEDEETSEAFTTWYDYWNTLFPPVTKDDIDSFSSHYKGSDEEKTDLINSYNENKGDMNRILEEVILATEEDVPRFKSIIDEAVKQKKVKYYKIFEKTCKESKKRMKKAKEEEKQLNENMKEDEKSLEESLKLQMQKRKKNNIIDSLISKYGGDDGNNKDYEIDEEEFEKTKKKICKRKDRK